MNALFKLNGVKIETERLTLRPFEETDLNDFYEYAKVPGVGEMAGWPHHEDIEITKSILDNFIKEDKTFAICIKETGKVIGSLGIEKYNMEDELTEFNNLYGREIGFVLSKDYWGRGLMPEAVKEVINYLFNKLNYDFLICSHYNFNEQSKKVQHKCGFKPYRMLKAETRMGTKEMMTINLLVNPNKKIALNFSHPETLIYNKKS